MTDYESKDDKSPGKVALEDFQRAYRWKRPWLDEAKKDFEYALGRQWDQKDVLELEQIGVKALTVNKIRPVINLLCGLESQNRTDTRAFPEGQEDSVSAEIATSLIKNVQKTSGSGFKVSDQFEDSLICGEGYLEPYLDFTYDLLNGELKLKKLDYDQIFVDPDSREYDLCDAKFVCKVTYGLTKDEIKSLYPEKEKEIDKITDGVLNLDAIGTETIGSTEVQRQGYPSGWMDEDAGLNDHGFDLLEHYYKKYMPIYYVMDLKLGTVKETQDKAEADAYESAANEMEKARIDARIASGEVLEPGEGSPTVKVIKRVRPEIWVCAVVGSNPEAIYNGPAWSFPRWKSYPFIPNYCHRKRNKLDKSERHLQYQGIVRSLKDPQFEFNKRRTQELRHLNQSANSGWQVEEGQLSNQQETTLQKMGSAPGVIVTRRQGTPPLEKIIPTPLSQGHAQLAAEHTQDMKEISGVNADLLAMQDGGQASGRAISLRQRQGLVMVQKVFDNLGQTKWVLGKFILTQLGAIYDIDKAARVLGQAFLNERFQRPKVMVVNDPVTGQQVPQPVIDPMTGQPVMEFDQEAAMEAINKVLKDAELGRYDVAISESATNETVRFGNYMTLLEMAGKGIPIPPDVLVDESMLSEGSKEKIKRSVQEQKILAMQAQGAGAAKKGG